MLGTSSQAPTRDRNQGGFGLKWQDRLFLLDPGEGFERQCLHAGLSVVRADAVLLTHLHGDHCLGLPGIMHRRMLERPGSSLPVFFPAESQTVYEHLVRSTASAEPAAFDPRPVHDDGCQARFGHLTISARALDHSVPSFGYRIAEDDTIGFDPTLLERQGIKGPDIGQLERQGWLRTDQGLVHMSDVTVPRTGQSVAFVFDTSMCDAAFELALDVDLLVCESTYLDSERHLAQERGHMTASDAGRLGREAGARRVVLTHFSRRYTDLAPFAEQAGQHHPDVVVAADLDRIPVPLRHRAPPEDRTQPKQAP